MPKISWDNDDFQKSQDSSGTTTENISGGGLEQGYFHGSLTRGLVVYYPLDSGSGSTAIDEVMGNDGTINGASWASGSKIGDSCLDFNGSSDYLAMPEIALEDSFTVSQWVNLDQDKDWNNSFGSESILSMISYADGKIQCYIGDGNSWQAETNTGTGKTNPGNWQHWLITYDGSTLRFFLNGVLEDKTSISVALPSTVHHIGARNNQTSEYSLDGRIDSTKVYRRPLSTPEVQALYNLTRPSKVSPGDTVV
ncbi:LamG domain-containing protein [Candidatus Nanosalina sp. VS9-1]|uniref:LamG domain-containing protein n=1 Tax=Candidatus Nanosalina sp. VS9-1 TaxID=3388566 RepID=UPI0039E1AECF